MHYLTPEPPLKLLPLIALLVAQTLINFGTARAQSEEHFQRTLAPYFESSADDDSLQGFPLKGTDVYVSIAGVIADVTVRQVYKNEGRDTIEATYVFPGSTRAAVYALTMEVGERKIVAQVKEKEEARATYEKARAEGKTTSLLEQHRPNVFQTSVANILPGDTVVVELRYTELIVPTDRSYQFVFPTVVGPRYSNYPAEGAPRSESWVENPYLRADTPSPAGFTIAVHLEGGLPIQALSSSSHAVNVNYASASIADVSLTNPTARDATKDFILNYRLAGNQVETGLLMFDGGNEKFFLAMIEPPFDVKADQIPNRDYVFVLDVSGSMHGFPLDTAKQLMHQLLSTLRTTDTFNVLLFSGNSSVLADSSLAATPENISRAEAMISQQWGGGGTELLPALSRALKLPRAENVARSIVIVTDGYVAVEREAFDLIRKNLSIGNVFSFGIGSSVNRFLIEGLAHAGMGEPFIVTSPQAGSQAATQFKKYIQSPVLTHSKLQFSGVDAYDVEPESIPDVFAARPVYVVGKFRGKEQGTIRLTGQAGKGEFEKTLQLDPHSANERNGALKYLWARQRLQRISDYQKVEPNSETKREITTLGLTYNLLTEFTSFVAVDQSVRRNSSDQIRTVKQPLPLPEGVSEFAVGGGISTAPEPGTWLMIIIGSIGLLFVVRRQLHVKIWK